MSLFLDSALTLEARQARFLGLIAGITTNPALLAQVDRPPEDVIVGLADICLGPVFYQLTAPTVAEREAEARRFMALRPSIVLKIPCSTENFGLAARLARDGAKVAMTATYSTAQCYLACQAGAAYSIPYVNRSTRFLGDGLALVSEMRAVVDACDCPTEILAASFRSTTEVVQAVVAGAHHVTVPLALILEMGNHALSDQAVEEFARASLVRKP
jgi:transaldolase